MALIYKDFANNFAGLNDEVCDGGPVAVPGGRAYLCPDRATGALKPYFDEIHFKMYDEPWFTHHDLRDRIAARPDRQGRVYAGCAGMVNLDYIAASRAPAAVLFDINPLQALMWSGLTDIIAALPDNRDCAAELPRFTESLYYRIEQLHGAGIVRDMDPPVRPAEARYWGSPQAPYRWMKYSDVADWARAQVEGSEAQKNWLGNPDKYRHVHELCRNRAVASLTLDVRDEVACARVAEVLRTAQYRIGAYEDNAPVRFASEVTTGAAVGLLYRSNVAYYLRWSAEDRAARMKGYLEWKAKNAHHDDPNEGRPADYTNRAVVGPAYSKARDNLRAWFGAAGGHIIAADTTSGGGGFASFRPRLRFLPGLAPGV